LAPPQERLHFGFSHLPGVHFHEHTGSAHWLSHFGVSEHAVVHTGGPQTVLHFGQSPCSQSIEGQTMAHFGGSHFCAHVNRLMGAQAVSHCGGAQTGSQVSSQSVLEEVSVLLEGSRSEVGGGPVIGGEVGIGLGDTGEASLDEVTKSTGGTRSTGVAVRDTSETQQFLGGNGSNDTGTTGGRDHAEANGTALTSDLTGDGVRLAEFATPETSADGSDSHLGVNDGTTDSDGDFFGALVTKTDVTFFVTDDNESLEAGTLTSTGLFLDGCQFKDFILEGVAEEVVDDLVLLDGKREHEDLFNLGDLASFNQTAELGDRDPVFLVAITSLTSLTFATFTAFATTVTATTAFAAETSIKSTSGLFFCHIDSIK